MRSNVDKQSRIRTFSAKNYGVRQQGPSISANCATSTNDAQIRTLHRPKNGWDRKPNHALADWCMLVLLLFGGACFFNWMAAALDVVMAGV